MLSHNISFFFSKEAHIFILISENGLRLNSVDRLSVLCGRKCLYLLAFQLFLIGVKTFFTCLYISSGHHYVVSDLKKMIILYKSIISCILIETRYGYSNLNEKISGVLAVLNVA